MVTALRGCVVLLILGVLSCTDQKEPLTELPRLRADGTRWVDSTSGSEVILQGVNLGNWFLWEPWMFGWFDIRDQHSVLAILTERFGKDASQELVELHRKTWITEDDFKRIREWGFNVVRLPFHYSLVEDPESPGALNPDGVRWLSWAVSTAAKHGLYTILDFHGAPGGQSTDAPTGRVDQNLLWESAEHQQRFISLWKGLAEHFKGNPAVTALDILNEPFGSGSEQNFEPELVNLFGRAYDVIRSTGNDSVLLAPGTLRGMYFWPAPSSMGWEQVGFTEHYYPGVFGGEPTLEEHARFFALKAVGRQRLLKEWNAPFLVGEFNPIFRSAGGSRMLVEHFHRYAELGWAATMWTYKMVTPEGGIPNENWPLLTNANAVEVPNLHSASWDSLRAFFSGSVVREWVEDEEFLTLFQRPGSELLPMEKFQALSFPEIADAAPEGWQLVGVGQGITKPVVEQGPNDQWQMFGTGFDINHRDDSFGFLFQEATGDFECTVLIEKLTASERWAKAGLMVRDSLAPEGRMVLLNGFPNEEGALMVRQSKDAKASERKFPGMKVPVWLRVIRHNNTLSTFHSADGENWQPCERVELPELSPTTFVGLVICSHDGHAPASVTFSSLTLTPPKQP